LEVAPKVLLNHLSEYSGLLLKGFARKGVVLFADVWHTGE
jgi:hypothetical protein